MGLMCAVYYRPEIIFQLVTLGLGGRYRGCAWKGIYKTEESEFLHGKVVIGKGGMVLN